MFTFPGQGSQTPNMLQDIPAYVERAAEVIGVMPRDDELALTSTLWTQVALFLKGTAVADEFMKQGVIPYFVAGHSIGAYSAAVTAGVISFEDALRMVWGRAQWMDRAYPAGYGMGIIMGLTKEEVERIVVHAHSDESPVYRSNVNGELQVALSGTVEGISRAFELAKQRGASKTIHLKVPVPSHSPLMVGLTSELSGMLERIPLQDAKMTYLLNHTGRPTRSRQKIAEDLVINAVYPVCWHDMTTVSVESGADCFIEMPPGHTLTGLLKQAHPCLRGIAFDETGMEGALYLIRKWEAQAE